MLDHGLAELRAFHFFGAFHQARKIVSHCSSPNRPFNPCNDQVGGIGIAPGGNINYDTGHAVFEATHGTAPKYANLDRVNPGSVTLSGEMMLRHLGWNEAADLIIRGMDGATEVKCSEFGDAVIGAMG